MKKSVFPFTRITPCSRVIGRRVFLFEKLEVHAMFETMELPVRRGNVSLRVAKGHFATNHSHINYYIDITNQKIRLADAKAVAAELAKNFANTQIDTILCMDGMTLVGACLAEALTSGNRPASDPNEISVVEPEYNSVNQMVFRDNVQPHIRDKKVLVLMASITTGFTAKRGVAATRYYGGSVVGVTGIYRAVEQLEDTSVKVSSIYSTKDLPDYKSYDLHH